MYIYDKNQIRFHALAIESGNIVCMGIDMFDLRTMLHKPQLNLKCKLKKCTFQVVLNVN